MYLINHAGFHHISDSKKDQTEAERKQQKNQAPMSEEEQEGEAIDSTRRNSEERSLFPVPGFLSSAPLSRVMSFPVTPRPRRAAWPRGKGLGPSVRLNLLEVPDGHRRHCALEQEVSLNVPRPPQSHAPLDRK